MKVLMVAGSYPPNKCGVGDYTFSLANVLARSEAVEVAVLTSLNSANGACQGKEALRVFPIIDGWRLREIGKVVRLIRDWSPDIVHVQYPTQGYGNALLPWFLPVIAFVMGCRVVQTWHEGYGLRHFFRLLLKAMIPARVVVVRPQFRKQLHPLCRWLLSKKELVFIRNASAITKAELDETERRQLREYYLRGQKRLVVFFGFVYPNKGVELLFEIADPVSDQLVIAGEIARTTEYGEKIFGLACRSPWKCKATITGFLPSRDIAALLAVADAVILPFRVGGGEWNTSMHAALLQGTFVMTTSAGKQGYDERQNIYYARIDDVQDMKAMLASYAGKRRAYNPDIDRDEWEDIALEHRTLYSRLLTS